jgi:hypothetical protein
MPPADREEQPMAQLTVDFEGAPVTWTGSDGGEFDASERVEQRRFRRRLLARPVTLRNALGEACPAVLVDVSPTGLRVRCDAATARRMQPAAARPEPGRGPMLQATLELPVDGIPARLSLGVRLVHCLQRPDPGGCELGFDYLALRPRARRIVAEFFAGPQAEAGAARRRPD